MAGGTGKKAASKSTQQPSAPKHGIKLEPNIQAKHTSAPKAEAKIALAPKSVPRTVAKSTSAPKSPLMSAPKAEAKNTSAPKSVPRTVAKSTSAPKSAPRTVAKSTSAPKSSLISAPKSSPKSPSKSPSKSAPKTEAKPIFPFPGRALDQNICVDEPSTHEASEDTVISNALPVVDTLLPFEMSTAAFKAPSAFKKTDRGYRSAGFRPKKKDISAGPDFVGFHLGKRATSPSKIEGPSWLKKLTEIKANFFKRQNRNSEHTPVSPDCKVTKNVVQEVRAVQQDQTSGLQKSVITNVPISHGFPGRSFATHDQETAGKWSEQFPNAFPQQEAEENMDSNTDQPPSRRGEQTLTNKLVDEVEPDPWPKKRAADAAEAGKVDEAQSPSKMSKELLNASTDECIDDDW